MTCPELNTAAWAVADEQNARAAEAASAASPVIATVATVTAGGASDGNALVVVTYRGVSTTVAGYLNSYTPTVGNRVLGVFIDNQLIVLGRVIGHP